MHYLLYLDDYHLDDLLFTQSLGRLLQGAKRSVVFVHGSGGGAERLLEAQGHFPEKQDGRFVNLTPDEMRLVEQGLRQTNRTLVMKLTDSGVPGVGLHGGDRRLLRRTEDGCVEAGDVSWLRTLVADGAVPVVSALVAGEAGPEPAGAAEALTALARAFAPEDVTVVVLTRTGRPGLDNPPVETLPADDLSTCAAELADAGVAAHVMAADVPLLVTTAPAFFAPSGPSGTRIVTENGL